jgi:hypothetical protein
VAWRNDSYIAVQHDTAPKQVAVAECLDAKSAVCVLAEFVCENERFVATDLPVWLTLVV